MKDKLKLEAITQLAYWLAKLTAGTLKLAVQGREKIDQLKKKDCSIIFSVWHGKLWFPAYYWGDRGYVGLASESEDGEYIAKLLEKYGWEMIRGSSSRGGARSIIRLVRSLRQGKTVAITPDGPTGPRHEVKSGIIYLAQKTNSVIIPVGINFSRKKVFGSWDKFELPWPFAQAGLVYGLPMRVEEKLTPKTKEKYQRELGKKMKVAGEEAEKLLED